MKGWGPKSSICPSKPGKSNFFGGISRDFAGISQRCPKSLRKKKSVFNFRSLLYSIIFLGECKDWGWSSLETPKIPVTVTVFLSLLCGN